MGSLVIQTIISEILKKPQITEADGYMLGACVVVASAPWKLTTRDALADVLESHSQELCIKCGMDVGDGTDACPVCGPITMLRKKLHEEEQDRLDVVIEDPEELEPEEEHVEDHMIVCNQCDKLVPPTALCLSCGKDPRAPKVVELEPKEAAEEVLVSSQQPEHLEEPLICYICEKKPELTKDKDGTLRCPFCRSEWDDVEEYRKDKVLETAEEEDHAEETLEGVDMEDLKKATESLANMEEPVGVPEVFAKVADDIEKELKTIHDCYPHHFKDGKVKKGKLKVHLKHIEDMMEISEDPFYGLAKLHLEAHLGYEPPASEPEPEEEVPEKSLAEKQNELAKRYHDGEITADVYRELSIKLDLEVVHEEPEAAPEGPDWSDEDMRLLVVNKHLSPKALSFVLDKPVEEIEARLEALQ